MYLLRQQISLYDFIFSAICFTSCVQKASVSYNVISVFHVIQSLSIKSIEQKWKMHTIIWLYVHSFIHINTEGFTLRLNHQQQNDGDIWKKKDIFLKTYWSWIESSRYFIKTKTETNGKCTVWKMSNYYCYYSQK